MQLADCVGGKKGLLSSLQTAGFLFAYGLTCRVVQVTQRYLEYLVSQRRFDEAASACARLLKV